MHADEKLTVFVDLEFVFALAATLSEEIVKPIPDCQAITYIKIRQRLTRQSRTVLVKTLFVTI